MANEIRANSSLTTHRSAANGWEIGWIKH